MVTTRKDYSTLAGILLAFLLVGMAMDDGGNWGAYFDWPSVMIVLGGTLAVTLASFTFRDFIHTPKVVFRHILRQTYAPGQVARAALALADETRRKGGLLAVQTSIEEQRGNRFFHKGLTMLVDGVEIDEVERVLRQDMYASTERHAQTVSILRKMAEVSPAMGLIGTLIGLVQMLGSLDDPSKIGPAMALALLTTFYGAMLSYVVFAPMASKLERNSAQEMLVKTLLLRSIVSIGKQENPRRLEVLLNTILPPASRVQYFS